MSNVFSNKGKKVKIQRRRPKRSFVWIVSQDISCERRYNNMYVLGIPPHVNASNSSPNKQMFQSCKEEPQRYIRCFFLLSFLCSFHRFFCICSLSLSLFLLSLLSLLSSLLSTNA